MPAQNFDEQRDAQMRVDANGNPSWPYSPELPLPCLRVFVGHRRTYYGYCGRGNGTWSVAPIDERCQGCGRPLKPVSFLSSLETK
jgi:hypothetical protein